MPLLTIHHKTVYRYARPVAFGEHRIMLRPRDGHDLRVLDGALVIDPQPMSLRWIHDVFGNSVAIASTILLPSGKLVVNATNDIAIGGSGRIDLSGQPSMIQKATVYG
ncbi:transglutaminase N-terminal domain-containing protein, partial [Mycoplasmoides pneumoniae]